MRIDTLSSGGDTKTHLVHTSAVNWVILQSPDGVTLIDGGYPGQSGALIESLHRVGSSPKEIRAALLTHAHIDHLGGIAKLRAGHDFPVYAGKDEVPHAHRDYLEQADAAAIAPIAWQPRVLRWLAEIVPLGALSRTGIPDTKALPSKAKLAALPGAPVAIPVHGHTRGHTAYLVAGGEAVVTGDALITGHMITGHHGPQCLGPIFTHDTDENARNLDKLSATGATIVLPGHGPLWEGPIADAVAQARTNLRN
ncbi:MAG: MBL fold metallo-hydrolase [Gordonia sp. (in: high G+C Gram-positive bacteria)]|uniref:MBL fold metallo-hydrolase n=1 Tax=Gordonia sp. (in: high G+C Gram-positive bacteria) TaxID=84139 RepID=UPI0039E54EEA